MDTSVGRSLNSTNEASAAKATSDGRRKPTVDAAVEFEFPIRVVGLPARETHVRLNALCPGSSSIFGLGRSQAIQTDLLRKLIEASRASPNSSFDSHPRTAQRGARGFPTLEP